MSPHLFIFFVENPPATATFYESLLGIVPDESSPTFAMFALPCGARLAFWSRHTVEPAPGAGSGGAEIAFPVADVDVVHVDWSARGLPTLQPPTDMDFGRTCVMLDPDGHRLRVFTPVDAPVAAR